MIIEGNFVGLLCLNLIDVQRFSEVERHYFSEEKFIDRKNVGALIRDWNSPKLNATNLTTYPTKMVQHFGN